MSSAAVIGCLVLGVTWAEFSVIASRSMYLPALVAVMTVLRVAAERSPLVTGAGHYVVEQPPSRRFGLLAIGSQIFGVLLNVGGFLLLMNIALRTVEATAPNDRVREIQTRRVTNAALRGFAPGIYWSPLGVAINLLLPIFPALSWLEFLPYGLSALVLYLGISWAFDLLEPRARTARPVQSRRGRARDLLLLVLTLAAIAGAAGLAEATFGIPLRAAILIVVPGYAMAWMIVNRGELGPGRAIAHLGSESARLIPRSTNEICVMTASGFVGLALAEMVPVRVVEAIVVLSGLSGGLLASAVAALIFLLSMVGISPVITGTLFVAAIAQVGIDMPDAMFVLAALIGWSCAVIVSPMTATIAIASGVLGKPASVVGLKWNGATALTILLLGSAFFILRY
ncbi:hypothetical protein [Mesobacterium pallidum]|uniref:hypothetical protein n=1 Tax=Mesobacterium pallidum TaxID=2872037 RepID=UPI001EE2A44F|nr:hypothetical protein [Mesobacterium pallidum]